MSYFNKEQNQEIDNIYNVFIDSLIEIVRDASTFKNSLNKYNYIKNWEEYFIIKDKYKTHKNKEWSFSYQKIEKWVSDELKLEDREDLDRNAKFLFAFSVFERFLSKLYVFLYNNDASSKKSLKAFYLELINNEKFDAVKKEMTKDVYNDEKLLKHLQKQPHVKKCEKVTKLSLKTFAKHSKEKINFYEYYIESRERRNLLVHRSKKVDEIYKQSIGKALNLNRKPEQDKLIKKFGDKFYRERKDENGKSHKQVYVSYKYLIDSICNLIYIGSLFFSNAKKIPTEELDKMDAGKNIIKDVNNEQIHIFFNLYYKVFSLNKENAKNNQPNILFPTSEICKKIFQYNNDLNENRVNAISNIDKFNFVLLNVQEKEWTKQQIDIAKKLKNESNEINERIDEYLNMCSEMEELIDKRIKDTIETINNNWIYKKLVIYRYENNVKKLINHLKYILKEEEKEKKLKIKDFDKKITFPINLDSLNNWNIFSKYQKNKNFRDFTMKKSDI